MLLPTMEMVINLLPNQSTSFSTFFLNYGHEPVMSIQLLRGNEQMSTESVASFVWRVTSDWELARENLERSVGLQQKYYNCRHRDINYKVGDLVLLCTRNLKMKGTPGKLQRRFVGPSRLLRPLDSRRTNSPYQKIGRYTLYSTCHYWRIGEQQT